MNIEEQVESGVSKAFQKIKDFVLPKASADLERTVNDLGTANRTIVDLTASVGSLEQKLAAAVRDIADRDAKILDLEKKVKDTEASVTIRANQTALNIEQGRGVSAPIKEEAGNTSGGTQASGKTKLEEYNELASTDAKAAGEFYRKNKEDIFAGK